MILHRSFFCCVEYRPTRGVNLSITVEPHWSPHQFQTDHRISTVNRRPKVISNHQKHRFTWHHVENYWRATVRPHPLSNQILLIDNVVNLRTFHVIQTNAIAAPHSHIN